MYIKRIWGIELHLVDMNSRYAWTASTTSLERALALYADYFQISIVYSLLSGKWGVKGLKPFQQTLVAGEHLKAWVEYA